MSLISIVLLFNIVSNPIKADDQKNSRIAWQPGDRHVVSEDLSIAGSLRSRYEVKRDFKFGESASGNNEDYLLNQARINLKWATTQDIIFFAEGQSADMQGEDAIDDNARPNIFADDFDIHQVYIESSSELSEIPLALKVGRQKFNFGDQRLVGGVEWSNTARVFDAVLLTAGKIEERSAQFFTSRAVAVDPNDFNDWSKSGNRYADSTFHGLFYTDKKAISSSVSELYYLYRDSSEVDDKISTVGAHLVSNLSQIDLNGEFAYQFGDFGGLDHSALAFHAEVGLKINQDNKTRLALAYNYGSGDDDATDNKHNTFDNLYPTNHLFYGYMDFFSLQNLHNLELIAQHNLFGDLQVRFGYQNFWLSEEDSDAWYNAGLATVRTAQQDASSYVGSELDITIRYPLLNKRLWLETSYGHFFTGDYVEDTGPSKNSDFFYLMGKFEI